MRSQNPFSPGRILSDPSRYAGRDVLVREAHDYLRNGRSLFITGRRGVGKSSFAAQLQNLLTKSAKAEDRFNVHHGRSDPDAVNVTYRCVGSESLHDLAERLLHGLGKQAGATDSYETKRTKSWSVDLKLIGVEQKEEFTDKVPDIITRFSEVLKRWALGEPEHRRRQLVFWIDEVDLVIDRLELGILIKVVLENLCDAGVTEVSFVLVGISESLNSLKAQHASVTRFVMPIYVPPMVESELTEIVDRALKPTQISFADEVKEAMHCVSQGFPDPVHSIGYELFEAAFDRGVREATFTMFEAALRKITTVVKKEEFHSVEVRIPDANCERALFALAQGPSEYSTPSDLAARLSWPEPDCRTLCLKLAELQFLEQEGRRGFRFVDPLFRVYLNMLEIQREADLRRTQILAKIQVHLTGSDLASGARSEETERALFDVILKNYRRTGRSGLWD